jgi:hypothetical protein
MTIGEETKYSRENLTEFFRWRMTESIEDFPDEIDCIEKAAKIAKYKPFTVGYITFKSKWRGRRFFWIEKGEVEEIDGMDCFLKVKDRKRERMKEIIQSKLFKTRTLGENDQM